MSGITNGKPDQTYNAKVQALTQTLMLAEEQVKIAKLARKLGESECLALELRIEVLELQQKICELEFDLAAFTCTAAELESVEELRLRNEYINPNVMWIFPKELEKDLLLHQLKDGAPWYHNEYSERSEIRPLSAWDAQSEPNGRELKRLNRLNIRTGADLQEVIILCNCVDGRWCWAQIRLSDAERIVKHNSRYPELDLATTIAQTLISWPHPKPGYVRVTAGKGSKI